MRKVGGTGEKWQEALLGVRVKLANLAILISFSPSLSPQGCDLSFPGNKLVSGYHCKITVDEKSGQALLQDTRSALSLSCSAVLRVKTNVSSVCFLRGLDSSLEMSWVG